MMNESCPIRPFRNLDVNDGDRGRGKMERCKSEREPVVFDE